MTNNETEHRAGVEEIIRAHGGHAHNLVQMLGDAQQRFTYISDTAIDTLAQALKLTRPQVQGVAEFYTLWRRTPRQYDVLFSDNIIEHMQGKSNLKSFLLRRLKAETGKVRADGRVCVDNTSCIGMSDQGVSALINGHAVTAMDRPRLEKIAQLIENQTPMAQWPREFFTVRDNIHRKDRLLGTPFERGSALKAAMQRGADGTLEELAKASIRGCGGAGFRLDMKWKLCRETPADARYVACNADEGEPGTFKDRVLLQSYADLVFEGMTLCGYVIGAKQGILYLRGEYRYLLEPLKAILTRRRQEHLLGASILGMAGFDFDISIHLGGGAYVCGAETAMIESMEGHRGVPRKRPPPFPVTEGYLGKPTVVNNVETLSLAATAMVMGGEKFASVGTEKSKGTKLLSVSGDCAAPGIYEFPFGVTVREVLEACGAQDAQAVQNSGPAGTLVSPDEFNRKLCFEDLGTTGSFMIFNRSRDLLDVMRNFAGFFVHESCGFCTPCRVGTSLIKNLYDKVYKGNGTAADLQDIENLGNLVKTTSHCGLGMTATNYALDSLKKFKNVYTYRLKDSNMVPSFDLEASLEDARRITGRQDAEAHL